MWVKAFRTCNLANQNTNGAIEGYHAGLKLRFKGSKKTLVGRRVDWLLYNLVQDVEGHFWYR
jgi:hypothetical protein